MPAVQRFRRRWLRPLPEPLQKARPASRQKAATQRQPEKATPGPRARQTAEIVRAHLGAAEVTISEALRERCFGDLEGTSAANYARVWTADNAGAGHGCAEHAVGGIESAAAVLDRATALVADLERQYRGRDILLLSHGDTLQILEAGFLRMDPSLHRQLPHLETAQIRELRLREGPAPVQAPLF